MKAPKPSVVLSEAREEEDEIIFPVVALECGVRFLLPRFVL